VGVVEGIAEGAGSGERVGDIVVVSEVASKGVCAGEVLDELASGFEGAVLLAGEFKCAVKGASKDEGPIEGLFYHEGGNAMAIVFEGKTAARQAIHVLQTRDTTG